MTEHTADLRREEIARIAAAIDESGFGWPTNLGQSRPFSPSEMRLKQAEAIIRLLRHAGLTARSQDTATARIATVLRLHYVTAIECDHETKMDTIRCNCSVWTGTPQPSVGAAVQEWVDHVLRAVLSGETRTGGAE